MKKKINIDYSLLKGIISTFIYHSIYAFVFALVFGERNYLTFILDAGYIYLFIFTNAILTTIPYIFGGYLIMLARNSYVDLKKKNKKMSITLFIILLTFFSVVLILQYIFTYRNIYQLYIYLNYPSTRYIFFLNNDSIRIYLSMFLSVILTPLAFYIGGEIRIKDLRKGGYNE